MASLSDEKAKEMSHLELYDELRTYFDDLDTRTRGSLASAAEFTAAGALPWSRLEQAVEEGWDPSEERIVDHLFAGVGVELAGKKDIEEIDDEGEWITELRCTSCGETWERTLDDWRVDWVKPETWTCPNDCNAGETL